MRKNSKATFVLPSRLLDDLRSLVQAGAADSLSGLVRESLEFRVAQLREEHLALEFEQAAADPMFLSDLDECVRDFEHLADEALDG